MSYFSKMNSMYNNELQINNPDGGDVNISSNTGQVKINGVVPSGGGGIVDPLNIGTLNATTLITTPLIQPPDVNTPLYIEANIIKAPVAGPAGLEIVDVTSVTATGTITANSVVSNSSVSANNMSVNNGDITLSGTGNLRVLGTGKIVSGVNGIDSNGDLQTIGNKDIISGRNIYFDGQDLYKRTIVGGIPTDTSYKVFQNLAGKNDANTFTANQTFTENIIMSGSNKTITNNLGTFIGANSNIETMTCGTLVASNGGSNKVSAKVFETRVPTNPPSLNGWIIEQQPASDPASFIDNVLQIKQGVAGGYATITSTDFSGSLPNIVLNPRTLALGGQVVTNSLVIGEDATNKSFTIEQPRTGGDLEDLVVKAGNGNFAAARFQNNSGDDILRVEKDKVKIPSTIPLSFGNYGFRPQQFYKDITNFSFNHSIIGPTNLLFNTGNPAVAEWTNVNTGVGSQPIDLINNPGAYKITIRQTTNGTLNEINGMRVMSDIVLSRPNDPAPIVELGQPTAYSYELYDGIAPIITMKPGGLTWAIHVTFPQVSNNETANIRVTLTQMPFFA